LGAGGEEGGREKRIPSEDREDSIRTERKENDKKKVKNHLREKREGIWDIDRNLSMRRESKDLPPSKGEYM